MSRGQALGDHRDVARDLRRQLKHASERDGIWMLRQPEAVRESYIREVLKSPAEVTDTRARVPAA